MSKLTQKERSRYSEAEAHMRNRFANVQCLWEIVKPKGSPYAILAGFIVPRPNQPEMVILAVRLNGHGWEVFGAPHDNEISKTFDSLCRMWGGV